MVIIKQCTYSNEGQDKLHGKGKRVWNETKKGNDKQKVYRCTVCNQEKMF